VSARSDLVRAGALALLGACASITQAPTPPAPLLPEAFPGGVDAPSVAQVDWAAYFADESLSALLSEALSANFDVQAALQRVEAARAGVLAATGVRLPRLDLAAGAGVRKFGLFTMDGAGNASTDIQPGKVVPEDYPDLSLGVSASWEPDLWGRLAKLRDSARAQYLASIEGTHLVVSAVVADVASAYFGVVAADRSLAILQRSLARQEEALEVMRVQKQAARATELAVQQFEAQVASTRALVAQAELTRVELENQLNLLLGRPPQPAPRSDAALSGTFGVELTAGAPSELLRNRPDVREAELRLQASRFDLEAARAAFYPSTTITAGAGYQAFDGRLLFRSPESFVYSIAGGLLLPVFNRAELQAGEQQATALQVQAAIEYQSVVLRAFVEVSSALAAVERAAQVTAERERRQVALEQSVESANALFGAGKASYLDVLIAQQGALEAELELVEARLAQRNAGIALYRALGGGWRAAERAPD